jgi:hypothetical protein
MTAWPAWPLPNTRRRRRRRAMLRRLLDRLFAKASLGFLLVG